MQEEEARLLGKAPVGPGSLKYKLAEVSTKDDNSCSHHGQGVCPGVPPASEAGHSRTKAVLAGLPVQPL